MQSVIKSRPVLFALFGIAVLSAAWVAWKLAGGSSQQAMRTAAQPASAAHASPALPAPALPPSTNPGTESAGDEGSSSLGKLLEKGLPRLSATQLQAYLAQNRRSAESLLVAARLTGDASLLNEALKRFPNDPHVQLEAAKQATDPAAREAAYEAMAASDPNNALGCYLAAAEAMNSGKSDDAIRWLNDAAGRGALNDYLMANVQATEEALVSTGTPATEAKAIAIASAELPHLTTMNSLSRQMAELADAYAQRGDASSSQAVLEMGFVMGRDVQDKLGRTLIGDLVGAAIQERFLKAVDPQTQVPGSPQSAAERLEALRAHRDTIKRLMRQADPAQLSAADLSLYLDRQKALGELAAVQWLRTRLGLSEP